MDFGHILLEKWRTLPPDKQQEMLDFLDFLQQKSAVKQPRRSLLGLCADLKADISEQDITDTRKEMWGNFPREIEP
ncbi:MAG: DUF2281 domain-containing protein [Phycisphaerae bacterium]